MKTKSRKQLLNEHVEATGKDAVIIGMFWDDPEKINKGLQSSIDRKDPYNEYNRLSEAEKKAYDDGLLHF